MSKIELNAREIQYLSALAGATELIGIPDGFYGMDELEIKQEIFKIQSQLESRGYAQSDFNGNFNPITQVMKIIEVCALCDKYIAVDMISAGITTKLLFYLYDNMIIKVKAISDKFELMAINPADIYPYILEHINWITQDQEEVGSMVLISQSLLIQIKGSTENEFGRKKAAEELYKVGCNNIQTQIICSGLSGTSSYYSVIIVDFNSEDNGVISIMVINSKTGSLELIPVDIREKDAVEFRKIDYVTFKRKLMDALSLIGIVDGGDDFI